MRVRRRAISKSRCALRVRTRLALATATVVAVLAPAAHADFRTVPGSSELVGSGTVYRFKVQVETKLNTDRQTYAEAVEATLLDARSWTANGRVAFRRVDQGGDTRVMLASPRTVDRICYPLQTNGMYSCREGEKVVLNVRRWRHGVSHWSDSVENYRRMLVNHEMGHRIGHGHRYCPRRGHKAPVMQQQTISLQGCKPNWWPLERELSAAGRRFAGLSAAGTVE
jgi:hypothetical protein